MVPTDFPQSIMLDLVQAKAESFTHILIIQLLIYQVLITYQHNGILVYYFV